MTNKDFELKNPMEGNPSGFFFITSICLSFTLGIIIGVCKYLPYTTMPQRIVVFTLIVFTAVITGISIKKFEKHIKIGKQ